MEENGEMVLRADVNSLCRPWRLVRKGKYFVMCGGGGEERLREGVKVCCAARKEKNKAKEMLHRCGKYETKEEKKYMWRKWRGRVWDDRNYKGN